MFNVDCLASVKTFTRLTGGCLPEPLGDGDPEPGPDVDVLGGYKEEVEALDQGKCAPDEPDPPDTDLKAAVADDDEENEYTKYGYKDFEDFLENAPWSAQCIPRECDTWKDDITAAAHGYPDTRYGPLGPTDLRIIASMQDDYDGDDPFHAQFGVKSHAPHTMDAPKVKLGHSKL